MCLRKYSDILRTSTSSESQMQTQTRFSCVRPFYHADRPMNLFRECNRVLRPGGQVVNIGEHFTGPCLTTRALASYVRSKHKVTFDFFKRFPPDPVLGAQYYRVRDYRRMCRTSGLSLTIVRAGSFHSYMSPRRIDPYRASDMPATFRWEPYNAAS